jgi:hypothetical protein
VREELTPTEGEAVELLCVWFEEETLQCVVQANAFDDAGAWGEILADVVRHLANAMQSEETTAEQTIKRIREVFEGELRSSGRE